MNQIVLDEKNILDPAKTDLEQLYIVVTQPNTVFPI